ncbi:PAS domain S-box-containing protein, partial [Salinibacter ruber]|uniref:PAS domain-containing sensor histidine kinase n=1 Tax=Salinibacter ruber TaxID=146919 RepID=UPI00160EB7FE
SEFGEWIQEQVYPNENGGLAFYFRVITERKEREEALREAKRRYQTLIENFPDGGAYLFDEDLRYVLAGGEKIGVVGGPEEVVGSTVREVLPEEIAERQARYFRRALEGKRSEFEESYKGRRYRIQALPVRDEEGAVASGIAFAQDITDQKEREEALREAKEEAERAKEEAEEARQEAETSRREAEESRREAEEAKEEAQEASRLKSALLANMSHEIRTPLTSIIGFAEMLGREAAGLELPEESPLPGYASTIERSGKRLLETLNGVLNLSKLQAGQMEMEAGPTCLPEQARLAAGELRPEAEEKGIGLELETGGGPTDGKANPTAVEEGPALAEADIFAEADEGGVQIVLRNLLSNAIKYTDEGGVTVRTYQDTYREDGDQEDGNQEDGDQEDGHPQEDSWAVLEVEDTGIGMDPEVAEGLFEPFRQASEGISREYEGTGIGLAVTREAVAQMGGSIEVETEKGQGTCMTVRLPLAGEAGAA